MKSYFIRFALLAFVLVVASEASFSQKRTAAKRNTTRKTTKGKTQANIQAAAQTVDSSASATTSPEAPKVDSLPIKKTKKSLRLDEAVETTLLKERTPLPYEHLRAEDAVYRHRIWREIDTREKINHPFQYTADEDNGNQRFISILLKAIQDSAVTVFNSIDDRFTTPMTIKEVADVVSGDSVRVPQYDSVGNMTGEKMMRNEINFDSIYRYHVKEEVIFDKESSRLFWRILGIAPVKSVITPQGLNLGEQEMFWVYYPDLRPVLCKYEVYNGKNYGARMSWEELFEGRMFSGRIIKSTIDNPQNKAIKNYKGYEENGLLQLFEGENVKEKIFNYEQDLWNY